MPKRSLQEVQTLQLECFHLLDKGLSKSEVASKLGVSLRTVQRWSVDVKAQPQPQTQTQSYEEQAPVAREETKITDTADVNYFATKILNNVTNPRYPEAMHWEKRREEIREQQYEIGFRLLQIIHKSLERAETDGEVIPTRLIPKACESAVAMMRQSARLDTVEKLQVIEDAEAILERSGFVVSVKQELLEDWTRLTSQIMQQIKPEVPDSIFNELKERLLG